MSAGSVCACEGISTPGHFIRLSFRRSMLEMLSRSNSVVTAMGPSTPLGFASLRSA